ncbi:MAG TPA: hypothetical protein PLU50_10980, partial [Pseudobdellovibrionaceae bacterium]|nr:hypothetical protein [Pseudobdellovibrionaceae bacterium]
QNAQKIVMNVRQLAELSKQVHKNNAPPDSDPTVSMIASQFEDEIVRSVEALQLGHREYARHVIRNSTAYCIECHTRSQIGPSFADQRLDKTIQNLAPLDRAEYLASIRRFDAAVTEFEGVLKSAKTIQEWNRSARNSLAITVRFQNNVDRALNIVEVILKSDSAPRYLKADAVAWKKALIDWKKEGLTNKTPKGDLLNRAKFLITRAQKNQGFSTDHGSDVDFLRASALLHEAMGTDLKGIAKSEALYLSGITYESLRDLSFWTLHEQYYEACIRNTPHTPMAQKCFRKYEENVVIGFSGSSGFMLPADVQEKLNELRSLAINEKGSSRKGSNTPKSNKVKKD